MLRNISRKEFQSLKLLRTSRFLQTSSVNMANTTESGQAAQSADAKLPRAANDKQSKKIGESKEDATRNESTAKGNDQSHAKDGGDDSVVPQKLQDKLPESVERAVPNALHNTGDK